MKNLNKLRKLLNGANRPTYVGLRSYKTAAGEIQNVVLNVGADYYQTKERDLVKLNSIDLNLISHSSGLPLNILTEAKRKIELSLNIHRKDYTYTIVSPGLKKHNQSGEYYLYGYALNGLKRVIVPGEYNSKPLTTADLARKELEKHLMTSYYRQYKLANTSQIKIKKQLLK